MEVEEALRKAIALLSISAEGPRTLERILSLLKAVPKYSWIGIYAVEGDELVLRAWKGDRPTEHVKIPLGKGVCGAAAASGKVENVPDVSKDPRYIACFPETKSELVVPIFRDGKVIGELDIDSNEPAAFDERDVRALEELARHLSPFL
jgi:L-methionine (R)-S-oxide reductase